MVFHGVPERIRVLSGLVMFALSSLYSLSALFALFAGVFWRLVVCCAIAL